MRSFAEELCDTEDAHLLEHVVLELLHRAGASPDIHGETVWRKGDDAYCVSIYDDDDVLCLLATRLALRIIDAAAGDDPAPDIGAEVAGLISRCDDGLSSARD